MFAAGRRLRPQDVGLLASIGAATVSVVRTVCRWNSQGATPIQIASARITGGRAKPVVRPPIVNSMR